MNNSEKTSSATGSVLVLLYCCVLSVLLALVMPQVLKYMLAQFAQAGIMALLVLIALGLLVLALSWPVTRLSKRYLKPPQKGFAVVCGLITGLPATIVHLYYGFIMGSYLDGFTAGMAVVFGGLLPIITTYLAVAEPKKVFGK